VLEYSIIIEDDKIFIELRLRHSTGQPARIRMGLDAMKEFVRETNITYINANRIQDNLIP
jgi:hypothetical protein